MYTAIEVLIMQIGDLIKEPMTIDQYANNIKRLFDDAKELEKKQIIDAVHYGKRSPYTNVYITLPQCETTVGELYYIEQFNTQE